MYVAPAPTLSEMISKVIEQRTERLPELLQRGLGERGLVQDGRDYVHWDKLRQLEPPGDDAAGDVRVAADVLGRRVQYQVGAVRRSALRGRDRDVRGRDSRCPRSCALSRQLPDGGGDPL